MTRRKHHPACDSQLGPDFEVTPGMVVMTLHLCVNFECWDEYADDDTPSA